jgi:hypothetical protein
MSKPVRYIKIEGITYLGSEDMSKPVRLLMSKIPRLNTGERGCTGEQGNLVSWLPS